MSIKNPSVKFIIFVLMICTFSIGYTEYAVMGILTSIANDFHIQVSSAGLLVTAYAASVCLTGPLVTIISVKLPRKPVLLGLMAIFILSNLMSALAAEFCGIGHFKNFICVHTRRFLRDCHGIRK